MSNNQQYQNFVACKNHPNKLAKRQCTNQKCEGLYCNACILSKHSDHLNDVKYLNEMYVKEISKFKKSIDYFTHSDKTFGKLKLKCMNFVFHEAKDFCLTCNDFVCSKCKEKHHEGHSFINVNDYIDDIKKGINFLFKLFNYNPNNLLPELDFSPLNEFKIGNELTDFMAQISELKIGYKNIIKNRNAFFLNYIEKIHKFLIKKQSFLYNNQNDRVKLEKIFNDISFEKDPKKLMFNLFDYKKLLDSFFGSEEDKKEILYLLEKLESVKTKINQLNEKFINDSNKKIAETLKNMNIYNPIKDHFKNEEIEFQKEICDLLNLSEEQFHSLCDISIFYKESENFEIKEGQRESIFSQIQIPLSETQIPVSNDNSKDVDLHRIKNEYEAKLKMLNNKEKMLEIREKNCALKENELHNSKNSEKDVNNKNIQSISGQFDFDPNKMKNVFLDCLSKNNSFFNDELNKYTQKLDEKLNKIISQNQEQLLQPQLVSSNINTKAESIPEQKKEISEIDNKKLNEINEQISKNQKKLSELKNECILKENEIKQLDFEINAKKEKINDLEIETKDKIQKLNSIKSTNILYNSNAPSHIQLKEEISENEKKKDETPEIKKKTDEKAESEIKKEETESEIKKEVSTENDNKKEEVTKSEIKKEEVTENDNKKDEVVKENEINQEDTSKSNLNDENVKENEENINEVNTQNEAENEVEEETDPNNPTLSSISNKLKKIAEKLKELSPETISEKDKIEEIISSSLSWPERNLIEIFSIGQNCRTMFVFNPFYPDIQEIETEFKFKFPVFHSFLNVTPYIYLSGGKYDEDNDKEPCSDKLYRFKRTGVKEFEVVELSPMKTKRKNHTICYVPYSNEICAVGGTKIKQCEKYNIDKNEWIELPNLIHSREKSNCCIINDCLLYVFFGFDRYKSHYTTTIEKLNLNEAVAFEVINVPGNQNPLKKQAFSLYHNKEEKNILIVGGLNANRKICKEVVKYDYGNNSSAVMQTSLPFSASFEMGEFISFFDGLNYIITSNSTLLAYDPISKTFQSQEK